MKKHLLSMIVLLSFLAHLQCSSEGGLEIESSEAGDQTITVSGKVSSGSAGDKVCLDFDYSFYCDAGEPSTTLKADRSYSISTDGVSSQVQVLVNSTINSDVSTKLTMASIPGRPSYISTITTFINLELEKLPDLNKAQAIEAIRQRFAIAAGIKIAPTQDISTNILTLHADNQFIGSSNLEVSGLGEVVEIDTNEVLQRLENGLRGALAVTAFSLVAPPVLAGYVLYQFINYGNIRPFATCYPSGSIFGGNGNLWVTWNGTRGIDGVIGDACSCKKYLWGSYRASTCSPVLGLSKTGVDASDFSYAEMKTYVANQLSQEATIHKYKVKIVYAALNADEFVEKYTEAVNSEGAASMLQNGFTLISNYFQSAYASLSTYEKERAQTVASFLQAKAAQKISNLTQSLVDAIPADNFNSVISAYFTACSVVSSTCKIPFHHAAPVLVSAANFANNVDIVGKFEFGTSKYGSTRKDATSELVQAFYIDLNATTPTWKSFGTSTTSASNLTSSSGQISFRLPPADKVLGHSYLVKMVLAADKSELLSMITIESE